MNNLIRETYRFITMTRVIKLYDGTTLKHKYILWLGWNRINLTGFWFADKRFK